MPEEVIGRIAAGALSFGAAVLGIFKVVLERTWKKKPDDKKNNES